MRYAHTVWRVRVSTGVLETGNVGRTLTAKAEVAGYLRDWFGWKRILDLGDITNARGTESYLLLWIRLFGVLKTAHFSVNIVK